jgi:DNA-binding XRE family transcriptional regulator/mannose-6-phosphate isomerase-like protein (cupin superfamily)
MSLRELARQLGVSPSFVSQLENGKSQPSVATLYSLAQLLDVSIDQLFAPPAADMPAQGNVARPVGGKSKEMGTQPRRRTESADAATPISRADLGSPADAWRDQATQRLSVTAPGNRPRLVMDSGVIWEQLASNTDHNLDFMEIIYPAGSSSTNDERMLRHDGYEYGYLLEGELQVTFGFEVFTLRAGESLGLDSSVPHLFTNNGSVDARGIWFVHHAHDA